MTTRCVVWRLNPLLLLIFSQSQGMSKVARAPPLPGITESHLPRGYDNYKPPLLHFGWSFNKGALLEWGAKVGIDTTGRYGSSLGDGQIIEVPNDVWTLTKDKVMALLAQKAGTLDLRPTFKLSVRVNDNLIIAISSNYRFLKDRKTISQAQIDTFGQYLEEQKIAKNPPQWHLDFDDYKWERIY